MSTENPFNNPMPPQEKTPKTEKAEETKNPQAIFHGALNEELAAMEKSGRLTTKQVEEKRQAAALIETGFSDDPKHDALIFSRAGIAEEKEIIEIFDKKNAERELSTTETLEEDSPIADFIELTESAKQEYGERMQKDIPETEKLELIQAILSTGRVAKYFKSIVPRIEQGRTIEEIIAEDRAKIEAIKKGTENNSEITRESTLRLAEIAVQNVKEKKEL
jgi:hypothetical protein